MRNYHLALLSLCCAAIACTLTAPRPAATLQPGADAPSATECPAPRKLEPGEQWTDPSPHRCGYVTVNGVRLHYLDWGGSGEPLVLLHGLGTTAHVFDDLAPQLTYRFRVVALTRRGHAESDHPENGYTIQQTTADLLAFLDALGIERAYLVGHSLGAAEATRLAIEHAHRVQRIVYLDGLPDWTDADAVLDQDPAMRPPPGDAFRSLETHRAWLQRVFYGFWTPALEADFRYSRPNPAANAALMEDAFTLAPEYDGLQVPSLAIVATHSLANAYPWLLEPGVDPQERQRAQDYLDQIYNPWRLARAEHFRREAPSGEVLVLEGSHYIHNSNPEEVARAVRAFLLDPS